MPLTLAEGSKYLKGADAILFRRLCEKIVRAKIKRARQARERAQILIDQDLSED